MAVERPQLFTPEEVAELLPPPEELLRGWDEMERSACILSKPELAAEVRGGYAAAANGRLLGWAPTWEELRQQLIADGWYEPDADRWGSGLLIRRVGTPETPANPTRLP